MEKTDVWDAWTIKKIAEWCKVTGKLRSAINNLDHDIYFCCYSNAKGYMTTKPGKEFEDESSSNNQRK